MRAGGNNGGGGEGSRQPTGKAVNGSRYANEIDKCFSPRVAEVVNGTISTSFVSFCFILLLPVLHPVFQFCNSVPFYISAVIESERKGRGWLCAWMVHVLLGFRACADVAILNLETPEKLCCF